MQKNNNDSIFFRLCVYSSPPLQHPFCSRKFKQEKVVNVTDTLHICTVKP